MARADVIDGYAGCAEHRTSVTKAERKSKNDIFQLPNLHYHEHLAAYNPLTSQLNLLKDVLHRATNNTLVERAVVSGLRALHVACCGEIKCGNDIEWAANLFRSFSILGLVPTHCMRGAPFPTLFRHRYSAQYEGEVKHLPFDEDVFLR